MNVKSSQVKSSIDLTLLVNNLFDLPTKRLNRAHTVVNTRWGRLNRDNNRQTETPKFPSPTVEKKAFPSH